uniref:Uncharacterized protein n=1 Tax=Amphimedon queenslandica TaxID=400682 RepID=A0A1X7UVU9_AMPQE
MISGLPFDEHGKHKNHKKQSKNPLHPNYVPSVFVCRDGGRGTSKENFDRFRRRTLRSRNKSLNANAKHYKRDSLRNGQDEEVTEESTLLESEQLQQGVEDEAPAYEDKEPTDEEEPMFDEEPVYNDNEQTDDKGEDQNMKIKIQQTNKKNRRNQSMKTKNWRN